MLVLIDADADIYMVSEYLELYSIWIHATDYS